MRPDGAICVLVIDDSPFFARMVATELERAGAVRVVTATGSMPQIRARLLQDHPEVIVLDLGLSSLQPLALLRRLRVHYPVPVIVTAENTQDAAVPAMRAIRHGALEVVCRPKDHRPATVATYAQELAAKIRAAASAARPVSPPAAAREPRSLRASGLIADHYLVAIGASTGGTRAIETLLERVPTDFPPTVIVQHMPAGFTYSFAARLNRLSAVSVSEAVGGEWLEPGRVLIARGDTHLVVRSSPTGWRVQYTDQRPVNRHCPSVDVLFDSVAAAAGARAIGILLTGMGDDGARGLLKIRAARAPTIAQSQASCVVYGMPKIACDLGAVTHTAAPEEIPDLVVQILLEHLDSRARATPRTSADR